MRSGIRVSVSQAGSPPEARMRPRRCSVTRIMFSITCRGWRKTFELMRWRMVRPPAQRTCQVSLMCPCVTGSTCWRAPGSMKRVATCAAAFTCGILQIDHAVLVAGALGGKHHAVGFQRFVRTGEDQAGVIGRYRRGQSDPSGRNRRRRARPERAVGSGGVDHPGLVGEEVEDARCYHHRHRSRRGCRRCASCGGRPG